MDKLELGLSEKTFIEILVILGKWFLLKKQKTKNKTSFYSKENYVKFDPPPYIMASI